MHFFLIIQQIYDYKWEHSNYCIWLFPSAIKPNWSAYFIFLAVINAVAFIFSLI